MQRGILLDPFHPLGIISVVNKLWQLQMYLTTQQVSLSRYFSWMTAQASLQMSPLS